MLRSLRFHSNTRPRFQENIRRMAKSRFEYVRKFEQEDRCLLGCWIVVRIDGRSFHRFAHEHSFIKPNDTRALGLMDACAKFVMEEFRDIVFAYGQSDEYSFIFDKKMSLFNRRSSKITTNLVSLFTSSYVFNWSRFFPAMKMKYPPAFDGRVVLYPNSLVLRDYLSWRQADCHINNLYNTTFWAVVDSGKTNAEAQERLKDTFSSDKNEILFSEFGINYNNLESQFRKGTSLFWMESVTPVRETVADEVKSKGEELPQEGGACKKPRMKREIMLSHEDLIADTFWNEHPGILGKDQT